MADTGGERQTLDEERQTYSPQTSKRKPDLECIEEGEEARRMKQQKTEIPAEPSHPPVEEFEAGDCEDDGDFEGEGEVEEELDPNGNGAEGGAANVAMDKGKGKMVEDDEEDEDDDDDDDSSDSDDSDDGSDVIEGEGGEEESDFEDDPLAEVDFNNILPCRTRWKAPPQPGAYLVTDQDGEDDEEDSE